MIVERERENRSEIVRQALTEYLERHYPDDVARARGSDA
jgi:metal-responsive CopG/Arc/MetJ family transcriptional regulator